MRFDTRERKRKKSYIYVARCINKPGNCTTCVRIPCKMASLLQGLAAIMLIHLAYIMLSRRTLYARSGIHTVYLSKKRLTNLCRTTRRIYSGKRFGTFFFYHDFRNSHVFLANDNSY